MKKREITILWNLVNKLNLDDANVKFKYGIARNKKILEAEINLLQELSKPTKEFEFYNNQRMDLCREYAEKTEDGQPKIENDMFVIKEETRAEFDAKMTALREEHKDMLSMEEQRAMEFQKLLEDEVDIQLYKIKVDDCPDSLKQFEVEVLLDNIIVE